MSTAQKVFNAQDRLRSLAYTVKMSDDFDQAVALSSALSEQIDKDLRQKYSVAPDDRSAVRVNSTLEEAKRIYGLIDTIRGVFLVYWHWNHHCWYCWREQHHVDCGQRED